MTTQLNLPTLEPQKIIKEDNRCAALTTRHGTGRCRELRRLMLDLNQIRYDHKLLVYMQSTAGISLEMLLLLLIHLFLSTQVMVILTNSP